ncbi:MAG TPA: hypothetical protein VHC90_08520, partial [Bryobacteraceae bacterium]|nr:hypothetical protein [Bryobacteraceae bacterium]
MVVFGQYWPSSQVNPALYPPNPFDLRVGKIFASIEGRYARRRHSSIDWSDVARCGSRISQ